MVVYHVTSYKKFMRYLKEGVIRPPVKAWVDIKEAERFSKQTGRCIILRLKFPDKAVKPLKGHKGKAVYINKPYPIKKWLMGRYISSLEEFEKKYLPKDYEKRKLKELSPEEFGKRLAIDAINKLRKFFREEVENV